MSFSDDARSLEQSLRRTHELMQALLRGLQSRRAAWVSARPRTLAPSPELEQLTQRIAVEENDRNALVERIRRTMPAPLGHEHEALHVNVTRIAAALPAPAGRSLREAADAVQTLAKAVRTEVTLGQRLVRFAQDSSPAAALAQSARSARMPGYDRDARLLRAPRIAGAIVDGKA
jgi:hypothetical protein